MKHWRGLLAGLGGALVLLVVAVAAYVYSLGPPPLGRHLEYSGLVLDHDGKLLRGYATKQGRWRLPAM